MNTNNCELNLDNYSLCGKALEIVKFPNPILARKSTPIKEFTSDLKELARDMLYTMYNAPGIGLAAPQIGKNIRMFVIDIEFDREKFVNAAGEEDYHLSNFAPLVFLNPVIINREGEIEYEEGCLSVPGISEKVIRANKLLVEFCDLNGEQYEMEAEGTLAVCIQHEMDHLDGLVFIDRLSLIKKNLIKKKLVKESTKKSRPTL